MTHRHHLSAIGPALLAAAAIGGSQSAGATIIGFDYIVHIDEITNPWGDPPPGLLPVHVGNAVVGTYAFDSNLPALGADAHSAGYQFQLPAGLVAHRVRFQLPTPMEFSFDNVGFQILDDYSLAGVGLPDLVEDEYMVGSERPATAAAMGASVVLALGKLGPATTGTGPLTSLSLPLLPPALGDFGDVNFWELTLSSPSSLAFPQNWEIKVSGHVVAVSLAELPEPATRWLAGMALLALALNPVRHRPARQG